MIGGHSKARSGLESCFQKAILLLRGQVLERLPLPDGEIGYAIGKAGSWPVGRRRMPGRGRRSRKKSSSDHRRRRCGHGYDEQMLVWPAEELLRGPVGPSLRVEGR